MGMVLWERGSSIGWWWWSVLQHDDDDEVGEGDKGDDSRIAG
jgi:hypothetical protein